MDLKVGDTVYVPKETNSEWMGEGKIVDVYSAGPTLVMTTGKMAGKRGGFNNDEVILVKSAPKPPAAPNGTIWVNKEYNDDPKRYLIFIQTQEDGIYYFNPLTGESAKRNYSLSTAEDLDNSNWVRVVPDSRR